MTGSSRSPACTPSSGSHPGEHHPGHWCGPISHADSDPEWEEIAQRTGVTELRDLHICFEQEMENF